MGSSKKHKDKDREHKHKRHHRSRSRSRSREHKKKEKRHRRRDESDDESPARTSGYDKSSHHRRDDSPYEQTERDRPDASKGAYQPAEGYGSGSGATSQQDEQGDGQGAGLSLSIEETNKLRASLGLKPLDMTEKKSEVGTTDGGDIHVPAVNLADVKKTNDLKEKLLQIKEKRRLNKALGKVKKLADDDSDDDSAAAWVKKSRQIEADRQRAEQMAKMLDDMDGEFNIGSLVAEEFAEKKKTYDSKDLRGLRVEHAQESFAEGKTTILVLKDKEILAEEDADDTLVNVNMLDDEHASRNNEAKKKKPDYKPYDEPQFDEYGMLQQKEVLDKYDEEIYGKKKESFELGGGGRYNAEHERRMQEIRSALRQQGESLTLPAPRIASEYYSTDEMESFKKPKKKPKTLRKRTVLKADDLLASADDTDTANHGSRHRRMMEAKAESTGDLNEIKVKSEVMNDDMDIDPDVGSSSIKVEVKQDIDDDDDDIIGPAEDLTGFTVDEDEAGRDLEHALNKARRLKSSEQRIALPETRVKREPQRDDDDDAELPFRGEEFDSQSGTPSNNIVLYSTSEFCRSLGDIPTYGQAGNRNRKDDDFMDYEPDRRGHDDEDDDEAGTSAWQSVEIDTKPVEIEVDDKPVLDDEPVLTGGIAGALLLAGKKGYLDNKTDKLVSAASKKTAIDAVNYSIEDKRYDDLDEKYSRKRDRYSTGITMDFKEKEGYKPDFKLDYTDDNGKIVPPKEAFRLLSHRFHGKGSGKKKTEKRMKKTEEEQRMLSMNSTDTPLNTVHMLKERQKAEKTPYVVLSGGKGIASSLLAK